METRENEVAEADERNQKGEVPVTGDHSPFRAITPWLSDEKAPGKHWESEDGRFDIDLVDLVYVVTDHRDISRTGYKQFPTLEECKAWADERRK
jgi:hypothetical protein